MSNNIFNTSNTASWVMITVRPCIVCLDYEHHIKRSSSYRTDYHLMLLWIYPHYDYNCLYIELIMSCLWRIFLRNYALLLYIYLLGLILGFSTKYMHPLLSSNKSQCTVWHAYSSLIDTLISLNNPMSGIISLSDCDSAMYPLSVVENAISFCKCEPQIMGKLVYKMVYPVLDIS